MIERRSVKATIIKELKHVLKDHPGPLKEVLDPVWLNTATEIIHRSVNVFGDSWPILAKSWNTEILKGKSNRKPVYEKMLPREIAGDFVAKLAFTYANKRFEQIGLDLRLIPKV